VPDLLVHVLVGYVLGAALAESRVGLPDRFVPVAMVGAVLPDLAKARLLVPSHRVEPLLGLPFSWLALHRLGPALAVAALVALAVRKTDRRTAFAVLAAALASHFLLDALILRADGHSPPYFYPVSMARPPAGGLYVSADRWPLFVAAPVAAAVWLWRR
jgi:membrane-bound metal-dependent hydrolase YbcI (DUF457 family)